MFGWGGEMAWYGAVPALKSYSVCVWGGGGGDSDTVFSFHKKLSKLQYGLGVSLNMSCQAKKKLYAKSGGGGGWDCP